MNHPIDQIFKKTSSLEIQPSADAWERLQLNLKEKKSNRNRNWYAIAASLVMLFMSSYLFIQLNSSSEEAVNPIAMEKHEVKEIPAIPKPEESFNQKRNSKIVTGVQVIAKNNRQTIIPTIKEKKTENVHLAELPEKLENINVIAAISLRTSKSIPMPSIIDTTAEETEPKTLLDQLANAAMEIKNGSGIMSEVRQFKDDVVSLEFFKTKKSI